MLPLEHACLRSTGETQHGARYSLHGCWGVWRLEDVHCPK